MPAFLVGQSVRGFRQSCALAVLGAFYLLTAGAAVSQDQSDPGKYLTLLGISSATVAPHGLGFASLSGTNRRVGTSGGFDGSLALGFGLGDADETIGFQVTAQITSLTDAFGDAGYISLKASRNIGGGNLPLYLGVTVDHLGNWGDAALVDPSGKLSLTYFSDFRASNGEIYPVMFTFGAGSNVRNINQDPGIFLGAGVGLTRNLGMSVAWTGDYVDLGAAFKFDALENVGFTATLNDVFDQRDRQRITFSVNFFVRDLFGR